MITKRFSFNNIEMSGNESKDEKNSTPRKIKKKHYDQKYSKLWEKEKDYADWIEVSQKGNYYFHCKACRCDLKCGGGKFVISKHAKSSKHLNNVLESFCNEAEFLSELKIESLEKHVNEDVHNGSDKDVLLLSTTNEKKLSDKCRKGWLNDPRLSNWIVEVNNKEVECKYCHRAIKSKLSTLLRHGKTSEHMAAASALKTNNEKTSEYYLYSTTTLNPDLSKPTCRVCLQNNDEEMSSIFDVEADFNNLPIYEEIEQCVGIKVLRDEGMPTLICGECYRLLKISHKFRTVCRNSTKYLEEFVIVGEENEKIGTALKQNPLSIYENTSRVEVISSQYETILTEGPRSQSQNENVSPSNSSKIFKDIDDVNFDAELEEILFDIDYHNGKDGIICAENFEVSVEQLDSNIRKEQVDINEIKKAVNREEKSNEKETKSTKSPSKTLGISSDGAAIIQEKKEKQLHLCEICGNKYQRRCALELHMRRHRDEKPYECEICAYEFHSTVELIRHMRKHTGAKPFKCSYCSRAFGDKSTLIKHERIHRNERPFKCETCGKSFTYSSVLKYHKYVHTGEKPYTCELCGKCFTRPHHLRAHLETLQHQSDPRSEILLQSIRKSNEDESIKMNTYTTFPRRLEALASFYETRM